MFEIIKRYDGGKCKMIKTMKEMLNKEEYTNNDVEDFMIKCYFDKEFFCKRVLNLEVKYFHRDWLNLLSSKDRIAIRAPTGFGKTSIFGVAYPLWLALFKPGSQSLIISKNIRTQSATVLEDIKYIIENNELLKNALMPQDTKVSWTKERIVTANGSKIFYASYSVNVRGTHVDYIFGDEVSTWIGTQNFFENVVTRVVSKKGQIACVSTPVSAIDLQARLFENPAYFAKDYPAVIKFLKGDYSTGTSIWPERFSISLLMKIRKEIGAVMFEKNYMVNPKAESENAIFSAVAVEKCFDYNRQFTSENEGGIITIGADFCVSQGPKADYDCFIVVEQVLDKSIIKHGERHRYPQHMKVERLKQLFKLYNAQRIILDNSHIGTSVLQDLRAEGYFVEPQEWHYKERNKLLMNMKNLIDNKLVIIPKSRDSFTKTFIDLLEEELIGFKEQESGEVRAKRMVSTTAHDDTVAALCMACKRNKLQRPFVDIIGFG